MECTSSKDNLSGLLLGITSIFIAYERISSSSLDITILSNCAESIAVLIV